MNHKYFTEDFGLTGIHDPRSENGQVFLVDYILLLHKYNNLAVYSDHYYLKTVFSEQLERSYTGVCGLYHRNPELIDRRIMSHDNLSAIMSGSYYFGTNYRFVIWKYLLTHFGTYDNSQGKTKQFTKYLPFNPSNFFVWGLYAESILAYLFLPFFLINFVITLFKKPEDTSGKILLFIELYPLHKRNSVIALLYNIYNKRMKSQYGDNFDQKIREIYHLREGVDFPITKIFRS